MEQLCDATAVVFVARSIAFVHLELENPLEQRATEPAFFQLLAL
jgi:hypothetical protein